MVNVPNPVALVVTGGTSPAPVIQTVNGMTVLVAWSATRKKPAAASLATTTPRPALVMTFRQSVSDRLNFFWTRYGPAPPVQGSVRLIPFAAVPEISKGNTGVTLPNNP